jgi:hypothetical protein
MSVVAAVAFTTVTTSLWAMMFGMLGYATIKG